MKSFFTLTAIVCSFATGCGSVLVETPDGGAGGGGAGGTGTADSSSSGAQVCPPGQKHCGAECVSNDIECGSCSDGWADCNHDPADGCETDLNTSASNCGACNSACVLDNASSVCERGICAVDKCNVSYADCNGSAPDGCEAETLVDNKNCGGCGIACSTNQACGGEGTCKACGADVNGQAPVTGTFDNPLDLLAWKYIPVHDEMLRQFCIQANNDGASFDVGIYGNNSGPSELLQSAKASKSMDAPGFWCADIGSPGAGFMMYAGSTYWIASGADAYGTTTAGTQDTLYASNGSVAAPSSWSPTPTVRGIIVKTVADCL